MNAVIHCAANHRSRIMAAKKLIYPAAERNKSPILSVLQKYIQHSPDKTFLEIASGSGQHIAYFATHFPQISFYPSEYESRLFESITAHTNGLINVKDPLKIDITTDFHTWDGKITPESNVNFNKSLKLQDSNWGLRDINDLKALAEKNGIKLINVIDMPANNKTIIWKKC
ncbi:methyltransferase-like 26 isoform X2 [Bombus pyrosoma]|uniref:methyltransferase-like 26 isoform X2 n=1 Tax=Bombus pyrosoma TaxID=396416 RepID=UPI001CB90C0E|nr:methyltransferase-like 26 isoform X2 [Bombus pyrosoma]